MKRVIIKMGWILAAIVMFYIMINCEIEKIDCIYLKTLWHNIKFISMVLYILIPLLLLFVVLILLLRNKWALRVEKISIAGFNVIFDNPTNLYKRQVRNFLDTKRTIFKINCDFDNFKETLDSYYDIYKFFRDEVKVFGNIREKRYNNNETMELYKITNEAIKVLNEFLTENQSDYRRWYTYMEKVDEKKFYLKPIGELQKEYMNYEKLCQGFIEVNELFINKIANKFEIDVKKWGIEI